MDKHKTVHVIRSLNGFYICLSLSQIKTCFLSVLIYINKQRLFKVTRIISKKSTRKLKMFAYNFKKVTRVKSKVNVL